MNDLLFFFCQNWPNDTIPPKLHLLEDHAADFMERWSKGHGIYGEQGAESIHKVFNVLGRTYSSIAVFGVLAPLWISRQIIYRGAS